MRFKAVKCKRYSEAFCSYATMNNTAFMIVVKFCLFFLKMRINKLLILILPDAVALANLYA